MRFHPRRFLRESRKAVAYYGVRSDRTVRGTAENIKEPNGLSAYRSRLPQHSGRNILKAHRSFSMGRVASVSIALFAAANIAAAQTPDAKSTRNVQLPQQVIPTGEEDATAAPAARSAAASRTAIQSVEQQKQDWGWLQSEQHREPETNDYGQWPQPLDLYPL